jgi:hypothetical protein
LKSLEDSLCRSCPILPPVMCSPQQILCLDRVCSSRAVSLPIPPP